MVHCAQSRIVRNVCLDTVAHYHVKNDNEIKIIKILGRIYRVVKKLLGNNNLL